MNSSETLEDLKNFILSKEGLNHDVEIPEELFEQHRHSLKQTKRTWVKAPSYRDNRKTESLHISDYRETERKEGREDGVIIGHVEHFNPEYTYLIPLHFLIDTLLWLWKNRIIKKNNL